MGGKRRAAARGAVKAAETLVVAAFTAQGAQALEAPVSDPAPEPAPEPAEEPRFGAVRPAAPNEIIVIGERTIVASLADEEVEQVYDSDRAAGFGVSTVGELIDQIKAENGDSEPAIMVNGRPVTDPAEIADLPFEALRKVETLPLGTATRIGGAFGQRAYNIVLKPALRSATFTGGHQITTGGGGGTTRGEALFTYIRKQDRINLAVRHAQTSPLFEVDRAITGQAEPIPFSADGNIIPFGSTEIDPELSLLVGQPVTRLALPGGVLLPTLSGLAPNANLVNPSNVGQFRTLRGSSRPTEVSLTGNKGLTNWLSVAFNGRLSWTRGITTNGLPAARFAIPLTNDFTPFTRPVFLALNDPARPLRSVSDATAGTVAVTFNANFPTWRASLSARYEQRERKFAGQQTGLIPGGSILVEDTVNPFAAGLAGLIPTRTRISSSRTRTGQVTLEMEGPLVKLPAGQIRLRTAFGLNRTTLDAMDETLGMRSLERRELDGEVGLTIPLTGRSPEFLPALGEMDVALEAGQTNLKFFGKVRRHSLALNWKPTAWLRFTASHVSNERAPPPEFLGAATQITENVPYFDPLAGQSVNVTTIFGGNPNLLNETQRTRTYSMALTPCPRLNMLVSADYSESELRNQLGALPPPSTAVALAFPERFVRDGSGTLVLVDNRSVNFERQRNRQIRLGLGMAIPLDPPKGTPASRGARMTVQLNVSHTILLDSKTMIRAGLGEIDLLKGGAVGLAGGQQRHSTDASFAINKGNTGLRVTYNRRGGNLLAFGTPTAPSVLTFAPSSRIDVKAFVDVGKLLPKVRFARNMRLSVACENVFNRRQGVTSSSGAVPFGFQSAYREPVGRTLGVELRMVV